MIHMTAANRSKRRGGFATIALVVAISLVAGTFAITTVHHMARERRSAKNREIVRLLESAIDSMGSIEIDSENTLRLPVDPKRDEWVLIEQTGSSAQLSVTATLMRRGKSISKIKRVITK
ncbi:MAG: hypothetical protein AAF802_04940 [Planctomycetota bacterium]